MRLDQLKYFVAAAECGSISEAARQVYLAQPAFSLHIKSLEQELGVSLFHRSARGVSLTEAGYRLYNGAVALNRHVEQIRHETVAAKGQLAGEVRLVLANSLAPLLAGSIFADTQKAFPNIRLSILDLLRIPADNVVNSRVVDFGLLPNAGNLKSAISEPVLSQDLYLLGRNLPPSIAQIPFKELHNYPLVMGDRRSPLRVDLENMAARLNCRLNVVSEQDSHAVFRSIVLNSQLYTIGSYAAYASDISNGALAAARIVDPSIERMISFVRHEHSELSGAAKAVMELLKVRLEHMLACGMIRGRLRSKDETAT